MLGLPFPSLSPREYGNKGLNCEYKLGNSLLSCGKMRSNRSQLLLRAVPKAFAILEVIDFLT